VRLTIDDFGTGYSSLAYLKRLPIDCVKIDASFVPGPSCGCEHVAITDTILAMSRSLGSSLAEASKPGPDEVLERRAATNARLLLQQPLPAEQLTVYLVSMRRHPGRAAA